MIECPICHNTENQIVPFCSKCGHHLTNNCNYCNRPFNVPKKPQKNKIDYYSILILKLTIIIILSVGIIKYLTNNIDLNKYNPLIYISNTIYFIGNKLDHLFGFTGSNINITKINKNNKIQEKNKIIFISNKNININDIKVSINLFYTNNTNKAQITFDIRTKLKELEFNNNADIYVIYLFKNLITADNININELDINPNLIAKFVYIKNIDNKTIINEKEYEFLSDNIFIKWMK